MIIHKGMTVFYVSTIKYLIFFALCDDEEHIKWFYCITKEISQYQIWYHFILNWTRFNNVPHYFNVQLK